LIYREEFVSNVPVLIESLTKTDKLSVIASDFPLKDSVTTINLSREGDKGVYYMYKDTEMWFCATFWRYFERPAPMKIYIKIC